MVLYCDKFGSKIVDVPKTKHWVILVEESYYVAPYDNYDAVSTSHYLQYRIFNTEEAWVEKIKEMTEDKYGKTFLPIVVHPARVNVSVEVNVEVSRS